MSDLTFEQKCMEKIEAMHHRNEALRAQVAGLLALLTRARGPVRYVASNLAEHEDDSSIALLAEIDAALAEAAGST